MHDLQHECYQSLFKCLSLYNLDKHRFVAYATNAIKNNMNDLIKRIKIRMKMHQKKSKAKFTAPYLLDRVQFKLPWIFFCPY